MPAHAAQPGPRPVAKGFMIAGIVLVILGILAMVVGVIYLTVNAGSLPSFMGPVHGKGHAGHRTTRGGVALGLGIVLFIVGTIIALVQARKKPSPSTGLQV
ncbi:MAG TPA: hypothetical protein VK277_05860 [Acidimicrobiales bacterium]|nr:hypothetical protein [Acidimicrobiales bacterium]